MLALVIVLLSVSKIMYLPLSTGHNNKGNPLIGVEHGFFILLFPREPSRYIITETPSISGTKASSLALVNVQIYIP